MQGISIKNIARLPHDIFVDELLLISSFPPRECGIATYSEDLVTALNKTIGGSFTINICPLESDTEKHVYDRDPEYVLNTDTPGSFCTLAGLINNNRRIILVMIQHEFGFFEQTTDELVLFLKALNKSTVITFHTVLPQPNEILRLHVKAIAEAVSGIVVMTHASLEILIRDYGIGMEKITVIAHGTHLVVHADKALLKEKYGLKGKKILSTFGFLSEGKNIETTLYALPGIIRENPDTLFLIIGKTHPAVLIKQGEKYREKLESLITELGLEKHVLFINYFLPLSELLEYLQLTDLYLFTSCDPNQAVSGTFSYAMSCGCAVVSTPIPHAREVLSEDSGMLFDFGQSGQLTDTVNHLLENDLLRATISSNGLHKMASTAWENVAIAHVLLFEKLSSGAIDLRYQIPPVNLLHIKKMTSGFGMIQFANINRPDVDSGYTLDDNARALIAFCQHYELTTDNTDLPYIHIYFNFIKHCLQPSGHYLNYIDEQHFFSDQNQEVNLADANGRAIWALGYLISLKSIMPVTIIMEAEQLFQVTLLNSNNIFSTRAIAFVIKGLYYKNLQLHNASETDLLDTLANRLVKMYLHENEDGWHWFESYLTYANSILPEALLCAWVITNNTLYRDIALTSFDFLLEKTFNSTCIQVISNKTWLQKEDITAIRVKGGEQPIDVAYTIITLDKFYHAFQRPEYIEKLKVAFTWFLGNNHLQRIVYNPCTGGCYDGIEESNVNLNQGAESTISYLMARLTLEKTLRSELMSRYRVY
jgi:glycosyltransferase involved in cell wall biosynthesis